MEEIEGSGRIGQSASDLKQLIRGERMNTQGREDFDKLFILLRATIVLGLEDFDELGYDWRRRRRRRSW